MQPSTTQSARSAESLDAVLGRFQAWSNSCKTDSRKTKDMTDGIRELSYEDALQSSRYRWQARAEAPGIEVSGKVEPVPEPVMGTPTHAGPVSQTPKFEVLSDDIYEDAALAPDTVSLSTIAEPPACAATAAKKP